jgi:hypothetical protein
MARKELKEGKTSLRAAATVVVSLSLSPSLKHMTIRENREFISD